MAGKSKYTQADMARVYVALRANGGNMQKTANEEGVPLTTIRDWRIKWDRGEGIPEGDIMDVAYDDFIVNLEQARNKAIIMIDQGLDNLDPKKLSLSDLKNLAVVVGVLDDKFTRAKGLDRDRNLHVHHHLPSADELRGLMGDFVQGQIDSSQDENTIEAEYTETHLLPA